MPDDMFGLLNDIKGLLSFLVFPLFFFFFSSFFSSFFTPSPHPVFTNKPIFSRCQTLNTTFLHFIFFCFVLFRPGRYLFSPFFSISALFLLLSTPSLHNTIITLCFTHP
ncbi:MAG: hypothetical protein JOS17DRAFT_183738 [Linnemannia elongata]|nr:MAG: hypothetical protein JOS17DRAFT_183738 [Linnemannia elongata]